MIDQIKYYRARLAGRSPAFLIRRVSDIPKRRVLLWRELAGRSAYRGSVLPALQPVFPAVNVALDQGESDEAVLLRDCERLLEDRLDIFGVERQLNGRDTWSVDHISGYAWPERFHTEYGFFDLLNLGTPSDVKVPWELNRLQFLPRLGLATALTGDERYAAKAEELLDRWLHDNRAGWGVAWACPMDCGIRAINIIWATHLLTLQGRSFDTGPATSSLIQHGRFLYRNIEYSDFNSNHHNSCLLGLLYLGVAVPGYPEAAKWRRRAIAGFNEEIVRQVYPDGVSYEGSIPYHRLNGEIFLHAAAVARVHSLDLKPAYWDRLEAMLKFTQSYIKPNGMAPLFGDNDDGRILQLGAADLRDHGHFLRLGAQVLGSPALLPSRRSAEGERVSRLMFPNDVQLEDTGTHPLESRAFPDGGYYTLRNERVFVTVDAGDVGMRGRGGHGHNDALSFELVVDGDEIFTDTGTPAYSSDRDARLYSLSAAAHNAPMVESTEPAPLDRSGMGQATAYPARCVEWQPAYFVGEHDGYAARSVRVRRSISMQTAGVAVHDSFEGQQPREITWRFHCGTGSQVEIHERSAIISFGDRKYAFRWPDGVEAIATQSMACPGYRRIEQRPCIELKARAVSGSAFTFELLRI